MHNYNRCKKKTRSINFLGDLAVVSSLEHEISNISALRATEPGGFS